MMSRIIVLLLIIWFPSGTNVYAQQEQYRIQGRINTDRSVHKAYLYKVDVKRELLDSVPVVEGKFVFEGKCPVAISAQIEIEGLTNSLSFFLEPGESEVHMTDSWEIPNHVVGGFQNAIEKAYNSDIKPTRDILDALYTKYESSTGDERVSLSSQMETCNKELDKVRDTYIRSYPNSLAMLTIIEPYIDVMSYNELSELIALFSSQLAYAQTYKHLVSKHKERELEQLVGSITPEISAKTVDGKPFLLSSLRGKMVLLDFWASWCAPCRVANRKLIPIYEKYKEDGFEMVSFSMDDKENLWKDAIRADSIPWIQISDLKGLKTSETAKKYFLQRLPTLFLIDQNGKVIGQNIGKDELENILEERFK